MGLGNYMLDELKTLAEDKVRKEGMVMEEHETVGRGMIVVETKDVEAHPKMRSGRTTQHAEVATGAAEDIVGGCGGLDD